MGIMLRRKEDSLFLNLYLWKENSLGQIRQTVNKSNAGWWICDYLLFVTSVRPYFSHFSKERKFSSVLLLVCGRKVFRVLGLSREQN